MLYTDDEITEYKHETVDNVEWHDEMTQDEITIMTDACDSAIDIEPVLPIEDTISREKVINTVEYMRKVCDTDDIDDYYELLKEAFRVLV